MLESLFNKVAGLWTCNFIQNKGIRLHMFFKIGALKNFANFTGKHLRWSLFLVKFLTNFIKGTPTQVFSCEIWKNYKNTFSTEHLQWLLLSKETSAQVCLPVKFTKFLRTPFFTEHLRWLLLNGSFSLVRLCNNKNQHYFLLISCLF